MRREISRINDKEMQATLEALGKAAARIKGEDAVKVFINDILTDSERITVGRRLLIANMILNGQTYYEIKNQIGVSPNTFTRVGQWLTGKYPDYNQVLKDTTPAPKRNKITYTKVQPFTMAHLEKNYPLDFLLFTLSRKTIERLKSK